MPALNKIQINLMSTHLNNLQSFKHLHLIGCKNNMKTAVISKSVYYWFTKRELITCFDLEKNLSVLQTKLQQKGLPPAPLYLWIWPFLAQKTNCTPCPTTCNAFCSWYLIFKPISWVAGRQKYRNGLFNLNYIIIYEKYWLTFWKAITKHFLCTMQSISNRPSVS